MDDEAVERDERVRTSLLGALALTAASALLPGLAHLRSGRRRVGTGLLVFFGLVLAGLAVLMLTVSRQEALRYVVQPRWLVTVMVAAAAFALLWTALLVSSYRVTRPTGLSRMRRALGALVVAVLCVTVVAPAGVAARDAYAQRDLVTSLFPDTDTRHVQAQAPGGALPHDPWADKARLNVLLLGGDGGDDRYGVRTDSMTLASIDTHTGRTVLLSLPRNLQHAPMPAGPMRERYPDGFDSLLNEVYQYVEDHPQMDPDGPKVAGARGARVLKATISEILGVPVDYYVLVNLFGFRDIVNALGGVRIRVSESIPYGQQGRVLKPGLRTLNGSQALWYGRSRTDSDDYTRMRRQRCLLGAIARQADPLTVLRRFRQIASATKRVLSTDIPRDSLPDLVDLGGKAKSAQVTSVQFVPPLIKTYRPDFDFIRTTAQQAIAEAETPTSTLPAEQTPPATGTPSAGGTSAPPSTHPPTRGPDPTTSDGAPRSPTSTPVSLDDVCQYS